MAIVANYQTTESSSSSSTHESSTITPSGSDLGLAALIRLLDGSGGRTISSVKWGGSTGDAMTQVASIDNGAANRTRLTEVWVFHQPGTTGKTIHVTASASVSGIVVKPVYFTGVHQTDFIGAVEQDATGNSNNPTDTITTTEADSLMIGCGLMSVHNGSFTPDANCTEREDYTGVSNITTTVVDRTESTTGSYAVGATEADGNNQWSWAVVEVLNAAGAPSTAVQDVIGTGVIPYAR